MAKSKYAAIPAIEHGMAAAQCLFGRIAPRPGVSPCSPPASPSLFHSSRRVSSSSPAASPVPASPAAPTPTVVTDSPARSSRPRIARRPLRARRGRNAQHLRRASRRPSSNVSPRRAPRTATARTAGFATSPSKSSARPRPRRHARPTRSAILQHRHLRIARPSPRARVCPATRSPATRTRAAAPASRAFRIRTAAYAAAPRVWEPRPLAARVDLRPARPAAPTPVRTRPRRPARRRRLQCPPNQRRLRTAPARRPPPSTARWMS
jgi:hypothetical protein